MHEVRLAEALSVLAVSKPPVMHCRTVFAHLCEHGLFVGALHVGPCSIIQWNAGVHVLLPSGLCAAVRGM